MNKLPRYVPSLQTIAQQNTHFGCFREVGMKVLQHLVQFSLVGVGYMLCSPAVHRAVDRKNLFERGMGWW